MRSFSRFAVLAATLVIPRVVSSQNAFTGVPRIVAVGDVHGDYEQFVAVLRQAGVINAKAQWSGGRTHLVQTGDVPDRGPDSRKVMELLMALAPQARKAGGHVHPLVGNHEAMNMLGDLRYVAPGEYAAFANANSPKQQERAWLMLSDSARRNDEAYRTAWYAEHPLGWLEHRLAFEGNGRYATWIRGNNAVLKINNYLFLHGGIGPKYVDTTLAALNNGVRRALDAASAPLPGNMAEDPEGPLWYRGLASGDEVELSAHVDSVLKRFGVAHVVVGHTVTPGTIFPRFDGRVITIDVGLSAAYGGTPAALIIEGEKTFALHRGQKLVLPLGGDLLPYIQAAAALDPPESRLRKYLAGLEAVKQPR